MIPLAQWYPAMYQKWEARLADLRRAGIRVDLPLTERVGWVIHHTVGGTGVNPTAYARSVADQHWPKWRRPGGYNFLVGIDGQVREMSGLTHVGAHSGTQEWNYKSLGLSFQGDFRTKPPPRYMLDAGAAFIGATEIPGDQWTHRQVRPEPTSCPGAAFVALLPLEATMTRQQILDTLGITAAELGAIKQLRAGAVAAGREISIVKPLTNLFNWEKGRDFPGDGSGVSEAKVRQIVEGSRIETGD